MLNVTVKLVVEAVVTVPAAPLSSVTVLLAAVGSKPKPLMMTVVESASSAAVLAVTTGVTVATCTAAAVATHWKLRWPSGYRQSLV